MKKISHLYQKLRKEITRYPVFYLVLAVVLSLGLFLRIYRVGSVLGFYFDQGRDAKEVWELLAHGDIPFIGPTTGIAGIFRGPFYFYLIAPWYLLGGGNPTFPAVFLAVTTVVGIIVMYMLASRIHSKRAGILSAVLASFSFYLITAARWLSNPTPMLLLSMILIWLLYEITEAPVKSKKLRYLWVGVAFVLGLSLFHFGSSGEFFYFLGVGIFALWQRKRFPDVGTIVLSIGALLISAAPLIAFDFTHDHLLSNNIRKFFVDDQSFKASFWEVARTRTLFYYDVFVSKLFDYRRTRELILLSILAISFLVMLPKYLKNKGITLILIMLVAPMIGLLFFQGNYGNIYDYYLTGYYYIFILLVGILMGSISKTAVGKLFILFFLYAFITRNVEVSWYRATDGGAGPETIIFKNQKLAIDWIYDDAKGMPFNVDVYVPPVIPHAYDYLFIWYGGKVNGYEPSVERLDLLYTLYEADPPHPERLKAWLDRQAGIGKVEKVERFGGITVERRKRIQ